MKLSYWKLFVTEHRRHQNGVETVHIKRTALANLFGIRPTVIVSGSLNANRCRLHIDSGIDCECSASVIAPGFTMGVANV